jgi:hypothetical protein
VEALGAGTAEVELRRDAAVEAEPTGGRARVIEQAAPGSHREPTHADILRRRMSKKQTPWHHVVVDEDGVDVPAALNEAEKGLWLSIIAAFRARRVPLNEAIDSANVILAAHRRKQAEEEARRLGKGEQASRG